MYPPGHVGITALLFAPFVCWFRLTGRERTAAESLAVGVVLSLLPDVDALLPGLVHRGVTHTLLAAVVAGVVVSLVLGYGDEASPGLAGETALCWLFGTAGVVSHLLGDVITPMGIRPLLPLWDTSYTFDLVRASSPPANTLLLLSGAAVLLFTYSLPASLSSSEAEDTTGEESSLSRPSSARR